MAKLTREDILKLARLSHLNVTDEEVTKFTQEISAILQYVEMLGEVDLTGLEPTSQVTGLVSVEREDVIKDYGVSPEDLLKNAPATDNGQIKVKRMLA